MGSDLYKKVKGRKVGGPDADRTNVGSELGGKRRADQMDVDGEEEDGVKKLRLAEGVGAEDTHNNEIVGLQGQPGATQ